jgi:GNAT superfamily N-acetyltransferase
MASMDVRIISERDWEALRDLRLHALADAPTAFASSLAQEQHKPDAEWKRWAAGSDRMVNIIAWQGDSPAGMVACGLEADSPDEVYLVSMWVVPLYRVRGVGRALVNAVTRWARDRGAISIHLWVTESNQHARALYERCGFRPTGDRQPLASHPDLEEIKMKRTL